MHMRNSLLFIFILVFSQASLAQSDVDFWFAAPDNYHYQYTASGNRDRPIYFHLTSFGYPSQVTISQPANPSFTPIVVSLLPNATQSVNLEPWIDMIECKPSNTVLNYGLHIVATNPITAYYEQNSPSNPDIFTLKGRNSLGYDFIVPSQIDWDNSTSFGNQQFNSFCIVATEDNTTITITPKKDIIGHVAGTPFNITLNKGQTYTGLATSAAAASHLGGTKVVSNKPIAISVNDDSAVPVSGAPDLLGDQIIPKSILGQEYVIVKGFLSTSGMGGSTKDRVYVHGAFPNTQIFRDGNAVPVATINETEIYSFELSNPSTYITATEPVLIYHCSGFNQQPAAAVLPPTGCTGSDQIAFVRSSITGSPAQFGLMIFTKNGDQGSFSLNGNTTLITAGDFAVVPGTAGEWVAANKDLTSVVTVGSANILTNSTGLFHCGLINGSNSNSCRYGFFSNFASVNLGPDRIMCVGDSTLLDAGAGKDTYLWSNGATTSSIWVNDTGTYTVDVQLSACDLADTIHVAFYPNNAVNLGPNQSTCTGTSLIFDAGPGYVSYTWMPGNTHNQTITAEAPGTYTVTVIDENGCDYTDSAVLNLDPLPTPILIKHY